MGDAYKKTRDYYVEKIRREGNENLAKNIEEANSGEIADKNFIEAWKRNFPEFKDELEALHEEVQDLQDDGEEAYNYNDYYVTGSRGHPKFSPELLGDELNEDYEFKYVVKEDADKLYIYRDGIWEPYGESKIKDEVRKRLKGSNDWSPRKTQKVIDYIKDSNQVKKENFKPPRDKIPFSNGVYDLSESEFGDFKPKYNFTYKYDAEYKPELENNDVHEFLETIQDNEEDIKKLKEITGLVMLPDLPIDTAPILFGKGANGKNQYVKINRRILGDEQWHELSSTDLSNDKHATAELEGKQMVFYDEFEDVGDPGKIKHLIGSENMRVRPMRQEGYTIVNTAFPIFAANTLPKTNDQTNGFFRRWEIIEFPYQFTKEDDHHKDLIPERELEERYMNEEAINAYATEAVQHLENVLDTSKLTNEQSTAEVRQRWNERSNPIYSFINKFLKQGDLPEQGRNSSPDYILKEDLKEIVNKYIDYLNSGKVRKHEVTRALENHADIDVDTTYRPEFEDGSRPPAYAGIQFDIPNDDDVRGKSVVTTQARARDYSEAMPTKYHVIADNSLVRNALEYLDSIEEESASIFELTKALDLSAESFHVLAESDYIESVTSGSDEYYFGSFAIDDRAVETALEDEDVQLEEVEDQVVVTTPRDWLQKQIETWSSETVKEIQNVIDKGVEEGFESDSIEDAIENLESDGVIYEPQPGKVQKL